MAQTALQERVERMKKPSNRKERVRWLGKKFGPEMVAVCAENTDREVKKEFEVMWTLYKHVPDYVRERGNVPCIICGEEPEWHCNCGCGEDLAIFSEDDPDYKERITEIRNE
ncbi:hypothetical protein J7E73_28480 [Paenibacillus albidus]|uniref:hypothetical protein n=1 Tax=Paenibacillus albidus TaxID=2041023 RepID=UPI001BE6A58E|nr:hypothetical protein [Paenibacillus albidus]MBT2292981.1 hypothetical protein [Paenibacillus albidus]